MKVNKSTNRETDNKKWWEVGWVLLRSCTSDVRQSFCADGKRAESESKCDSQDGQKTPRHSIKSWPRRYKERERAERRGERDGNLSASFF